VLFGDVNPGGKLPITFPRSVGQIPIFYSHRPSGGRSHWKGDYVETSSKPLYPFGFGLSYTCFEFSNFNVDASTTVDGAVTVKIDVTNKGERAGDEVVQLYVHQQVPMLTRPLKELKAFKRVTIEPGQTRTVSFLLSAGQLGFYDLDQNFVVEPGIVEVMVGNSSQDIHCSGSFEILGEKKIVTENKVFFSEVIV
jgi:beta-glucosidase